MSAAPWKGVIRAFVEAVRAELPGASVLVTRFHLAIDPPVDIGRGLDLQACDAGICATEHIIRTRKPSRADAWAAGLRCAEHIRQTRPSEVVP